MFTNTLSPIDRCLEIYTLGHFVVKSEKKVFSDDCIRSQQLWCLFNYIFTHRYKQIQSDHVFDALWADKECDNPEKALKNLVYRLRQLFNDQQVPLDGESLINYSHGSYSWNLNCQHWTDVDEFEKLFANAKTAQKNNDAPTAIALYQSAFLLYKGDYLTEYSYIDWVTPHRSHYRRIYLQIIDQLVDLYKKEQRYSDIIRTCEAALNIEPFEEVLHQYLIEALIESGEIKQAQSRYEYVTSLLYKEMGVKPSPALHKLYRRIETSEKGIQLDLGEIQEMMVDRKDSEGAFFCDAEFFRQLYKLECRRISRTGQVVYLIMMTVSSAKNRSCDNRVIKKGLMSLLDILVSALRKGDVVTAWNDSQILALLPEITFEQAEKVLARIQDLFAEYSPNDAMVVKTSLQAIYCPDESKSAIA